MDDASFRLARDTILDVLHLDIHQYKDAQMRRRLHSFVARWAVGDVRSFCRRLTSERRLAEELRAFLTINVSEFFRDPEQFAYLRSHILPRLLASTGSLRISSAGCAAGEEAYSIAILLAEMGALDRADIHATDIDSQALGRAQARGPYREHDLRNVDGRRRTRFFRASSDGLHLRDEIASAVTFRRHNLLQPGLDDRCHLIVCRNVMIYFTTEVKRRLIRRFHSALRPSGVLFVGGTEGLISSDQAGFQRLFGHFYERVEAVPSGNAGAVVALGDTA